MIPFVEAPGGGAIGMSPCPGAPAHDGDALLRHVAAFRAMGASALVSLITARENVPRTPREIGDAAARAGLEWHWLPIADMHVPDREFEERWATAGPVLRARLRRGERVVVHCRGGRGRSGTVAARLLVELGVDPERAIAAVRAVNGGAIETAAQELHVRGCVA
ncbi:MAG: phosphatase [Thermodesulfobacteriota bacterium]